MASVAPRNGNLIDTVDPRRAALRRLARRRAPELTTGELPRMITGDNKSKAALDNPNSRDSALKADLEDKAPRSGNPRAPEGEKQPLRDGGNNRNIPPRRQQEQSGFGQPQQQGFGSQSSP